MDGIFFLAGFSAWLDGADRSVWLDFCVCEMLETDL
jgi:hypothetical protein